MVVSNRDKFLPIPVLSKLGWTTRDGVYQQTLFDPVQSHGVYGLTETTLPLVKEALKEMGAKRFRVVGSKKFGRYILCYKSNIPNPEYDQ